MRNKQIKEIGGYPSPFAPKKVKDKKEYGLKYFKKMYHEWSGQGQNSVAGRKRRFNTARQYASGTQSVEKYKSLLNKSGDQSYMNLDWSNLSIIPKFVNSMSIPPKSQYSMAPSITLLMSGTIINCM